ncbi:MAG TPA: hypothetical protein VFW40_03275 [Capsulimonadaceae bacterium]|nr:hypothetical protein [Capsulimonadaceae bacterium]
MNKAGIGLWFVLLAVLLLDIGLNCVNAQGGSPGVVKTQEVQVVDSRGNTLIDLHVNKSGDPIIAMKDA